MLRDHGEFHPFGGYVNLDGRVIHVGLDPQAPDMSGDARFADLVTGLRKLSPNALACGPAANVSIDNPESDSAVRFNLEHRDGYTAEVFYPYLISSEGPLFAPPFAQKSDRLFFSGLPDER